VVFLWCSFWLFVLFFLGILTNISNSLFWFLFTFFAVMIQKALLTGGLVLVAPGSSTQILVGLVIALTFYTVLLKTQPYADNTEDIMQSIATASTVGTLLIGFALKATLSENMSSGGMYDMVIMDCILVGMFTLVAVSGLYMILISLPCFASGGEEEKESPEETAVEMVNQPTAAMSHPSPATKSLPLMPFKSKKHLFEEQNVAIEKMFQRLDDNSNGTLEKSEVMVAALTDPELSKCISPGRAMMLQKQMFVPMTLPCVIYGFVHMCKISQ